MFGWISKKVWCRNDTLNLIPINSHHRASIKDVSKGVIMVIECDGTEVVTLKKRIQAYYSNYGGLPECFLEPGDRVRIVAKKVPSVRGPRPYFTLVDFEKYGHTWRASLYPGDFK